jgi:hypothetical protein
MPYTDRFLPLDGLIAHLDTLMPTITDPFLRSQYIGFLSVSVVSVLELCIKEICIAFAEKKHKSFGAYCANNLERMNGRISLKDLKEMHVKKFGEKYQKRFEATLNASENSSLSSVGVSVKSSYGNLVVWRNSFAHEAILPANASYAEMRKGYDAGKRVLECLKNSLVR